jgi:zinc protease
LSPALGEIKERFSGSSTPADFETLMQLMYLYFEEPRFEKESYDALLLRMKASLEFIAKNPEKAISDSITTIMASHHPREMVLDSAFLANISFEKVQAVHQNRFQDAGDFVFIIVGNIPEDSVRMMAAKYLGSLTDKPRTESWIDRGVRSPKGKTVKEIAVPMTTPKTSVRMDFSADLPFNPYNIMITNVVRDILTIRFTELIREQEGGTYGVQVSKSLTHFPISRNSLTISFNCDPERAGYLKEVVYRYLDSLATVGPVVADFDKTIQNLKKQREQAKEHNSYWLNALYELYDNGYNTASPEYFEHIIEKLTPEDVRTFAADFFKRADVVDLLFKPSPAEEKLP